MNDGLIRRRHARRKIEEGDPATPAGPREVFLYVRVSTAKQDQSPADQRTIGARLAETNNLAINGTFQDAPVKTAEGRWNDAQSGKIPLFQRPAGKELCHRLKAGDIVVASKFDRLFRRLSDAAIMMDKWERIGVRLLIGDFPMLADLNNPFQKAFLQQAGVYAELERKLTAQRTREALALRKMEGSPVSRYVGYGFKLERRYCPSAKKVKRYKVADPDERIVMGEIVKWRVGGSTFEEIYFHLLMAKILTRDGTEWSYDRIRRAFLAELELQRSENSRTG